MEKKKTREIGIKEWILLLAAGVLLMFFSFSDRFTKTSEEEQVPTSGTTVNDSEEDYSEKMENKLKNLLLKIEGVTSVSVLITFEDTGEEVVLTDTKEPYPINEKTPRAKGVAVIISGNGREKQLQISEAVQALFDLPAHKVKVIWN